MRAWGIATPRPSPVEPSCSRVLRLCRTCALERPWRRASKVAICSSNRHLSGTSRSKWISRHTAVRQLDSLRYLFRLLRNGGLNDTSSLPQSRIKPRVCRGRRARVAQTSARGRRVRTKRKVAMATRRRLAHRVSRFDRCGRGRESTKPPGPWQPQTGQLQPTSTTVLRASTQTWLFTN
jgi:hypothetical protein